MRKILAMLLACGMLCGALAGCGNSDSGNTSGTTPADNSGAAADTGTSVGSSGSESMTLIMSQRDEFLSELESAAINAANQLGVNRPPRTQTPTPAKCSNTLRPQRTPVKRQSLSTWLTLKLPHSVWNQQAI